MLNNDTKTMQESEKSRTFASAKLRLYTIQTIKV